MSRALCIAGNVVHYATWIHEADARRPSFPGQCFVPACLVFQDITTSSDGSSRSWPAATAVQDPQVVTCMLCLSFWGVL